MVKGMWGGALKVGGIQMGDGSSGLSGLGRTECTGGGGRRTFEAQSFGSSFTVISGRGTKG